MHVLDSIPPVTLNLMHLAGGRPLRGVASIIDLMSLNLLSGMTDITIEDARIRTREFSDPCFSTMVLT